MENGATLYSGGRVLVLDGVTPPQEALVVRDGRVAGVGDAGDMTRLAGQGARCVSVRGATIMPGLIDTHPHLLHFGAFTEPLVDLSDARDHDEIVARIRRRAAETPAGEWIMTTPVGEPHYFLRRSIREFEEHLEQALALTDVTDDQLRSNGVTLSRGGPCWPGFLRMHELYRGPYGEPTEGVTFVEPEKEEFALAFCARRGLRLNFIGAGYRDHDDFLPRGEAVAATYSTIRDRGWILQHAYLVTEVQARRYAALGFRVTTSMSFSWGKGDLFAERIGKHVWPDLIPLRRLLDAGLIVGCGTDWGPKNVFEQIELTETHRFCGSDYRNDGPAQKVTRQQALLMWTRDAARVLGWEGIGTPAPGSRADLIVVDREPLECPLDALAGTRVLRTVVGGRSVFEGGV